MIKNPCVDCLVFPMCKARAMECRLTFNPSGMFAYLKGHCAILHQAYYDYKNGLKGLTVMPYSEQPFCKQVLKHFDIPFGRTTHAG